MRELAEVGHIEQFMRALGRAAKSEGRVYLTGGATAVLYGWRESTIDVDIKVVPDNDDLLPEGTDQVAVLARKADAIAVRELAGNPEITDEITGDRVENLCDPSGIRVDVVQGGR